MNVERLTTKYTGHRIEADQLTDAHRRGGLPAALAQALETAAEAVAGAEAELIRLSSSIIDDCGKVRSAVDAGPGQQAPTLNPLGELQARGRAWTRSSPCATTASPTCARWSGSGSTSATAATPRRRPPASQRLRVPNDR